MQCYTEIVPPSGVTHALALPFISADATNLVIARTSLLQIFNIKHLNQGQDAKLVLVAEYYLSGVVASLGRVQLQSTSSGGHAVLIAFRDAKLSLIEWDPTLHSIATISIHYYENNTFQTAPWHPDLKDCVSHLTIDPNSRCAAFNFGVSNLAVIPFHQGGDDLAMDDIDGEPLDRVTTKQTNGDAADNTKPYFPSFVLSLTTLDPSLLHPLDFAFLHEYRDPTVGVLYTTAARSNNMSFERRDVTIYSVYAMEIENRVSTTLQTVANLPNDIFAILALPLPVGGALLVGGNELIHIDQGGKPTGIAVNEFAREASSFPLADHSACRMKLEGCQIEQLGNSNGDMVVILNTGEIAVLTFRLDGRSVSGMSLRRLEAGYLQDLISSSATCVASVASGTIFIGSEDSHSLLLSTGKRQSQLKRTASRMQLATNYANGAEEVDSVSEEEDDDDLYGERANVAKPSGGNETGSGLNIRLLDILACVGPLHDVAFGRSLKRKRESRDDGDVDASDERLTLAAACGRGQAGGLSIFSPKFSPSQAKRVNECEASNLWSFNNKDTAHVIMSEIPSEGPLRSSLWIVDGDHLERVEGTDFEASTGSTLAVFSINTSKHTVHVTGIEIRVYDSDFGLSQIFPIVDEDEGQNARAVRASFVEPFLVLLKDDSSMTLLKADRNGELEELELPEPLSNTAFVSAALYLDQQDFFQASRFQKSKLPDHNILLLLFTKEGALVLLPMANPQVQIFQAEGLQFLPTHLSPNVAVPKHWRYRDELSDVMMAQIGDSTEQQPYMVVRNTSGDIAIYEPYALPDVVGSFQFKKVAHRNAEYNSENEGDEDGEALSTLPPFQIIEDFGGFSTVFIPGHSARIILKQAATPPRIYAVEQIKSLCSLRGLANESDFLFVDDKGGVCSGSVQSNALIGVSEWMIEKVDLHQEVVGLTYFPTADAYIVGTDDPSVFQLPQDDEWHPEWQKESTSFLPTGVRGSIKLISGKDYRILSEHHFGPDERVLCVKTMNLEVSDKSHEMRDLVVVGTGVIRGENVVTRGNLYLFDIARVVPREDQTEFDIKLKLLTHEDVRGAVTCICPIGSQGFVLAAQGQKCMVRGLREDMSILPVAFMDMQYYVHVAKSLASTGLTILGDAFSGLWLMGYSEEPYKMELLAKDVKVSGCLAADFLPADKELYIISSDADGQLKVFQYDPQTPKGIRELLLRSTFETGAIPTSMTLIPRTPTSYDQDSQGSSSGDAMAVDSPTTPAQQILITTQSGSLALMTALPDNSYRRLSTLQNILLNQLEHPCSLNPRAFRAVEIDGIGGRGVIDGDLVKRWLSLSSQHKASLADKVGARGVWELRSDMELILGSSGMKYLQ
jgi:cleavage and polyadenylation specificity factor subunit 1